MTQMEQVQDRLLTISQIVNLTGASAQTVKNRIIADMLPAVVVGEGEAERVMVRQSDYERAVKDLVFEALDPDNHPGRPRDARIPRVCGNPECGLTFLVIKSSAAKRGPYCSAECAVACAKSGELSYAEAGALIAVLRGQEKALSRERVSQYVQQGRLTEPLTRAGIEAAHESGALSPRPGIRGRLQAPKGYMTTAEFADRTGLSTSTVGDMCARGTIRAKKERGGYIISEAALPVQSAKCGVLSGERGMLPTESSTQNSNPST